MHSEILLKSRFFAMVDVTITVFGSQGKSWTQPNIWVNRDHMLALSGLSSASHAFAAEQPAQAQRDEVRSRLKRVDRLGRPCRRCGASFGARLGRRRDVAPAGSSASTLALMHVAISWINRLETSSMTPRPNCATLPATCSRS